MKTNMPSPINGVAIEKPSRCYTEYNIFFQIEREYILQVLLGVNPKTNVAPGDSFDTKDESYLGPPLPKRYRGLVLAKDWYVPGKKKRRIRKHEKSHGKISFVELSRKIAASWSCVKEDVKDFCAKLCMIGMAKYREDMKRYLQSVNSKEDSSRIRSEENSRSDYMHRQEVDPAQEDPKTLENQGNGVVKTENHPHERTDFNTTLTVLFDHFTSDSIQKDTSDWVSMDDGDIRRMWISRYHDYGVQGSNNDVFLSSFTCCMEIGMTPDPPFLIENSGVAHLNPVTLCQEVGPNATKHKIVNVVSPSPRRVTFDEQWKCPASLMLCPEIGSKKNLVSPIQPRAMINVGPRNSAFNAQTFAKASL